MHQLGREGGVVAAASRRPVAAGPYPLRMVIDLPAIAPRPRPTALRWVYTVLLMTVLVGLPWAAREATTALDDSASGSWPPPALVLFILGALIARRVSYRWFDAFLLLIPLFGLIYMWRFAWRLSFLPYRDWPPRPDEAPHWRKVAHPDRPGAGLYLVDPAAHAER
jgi:hypothetical protein